MANTEATQGPQRERAIQPGFVSHTELASKDPGATKQWCRDVLGWKFGPAAPMPEGPPYEMWSFGNDMGGGIRATMPNEPSGTTPYCEVPDIKAAFQGALKAGATEMHPPNEIPGGMGWIAIVMAPGGVPIGFWAPK